MNFLDGFSKNTSISTFMKIFPVGTEFFYADRQTDMTKLIVAIRSFTKEPKYCYAYCIFLFVLISSILPIQLITIIIRGQFNDALPPVHCLQTLILPLATIHFMHSMLFSQIEPNQNKCSQSGRETMFHTPMK